jgi:hypothetical protein
MTQFTTATLRFLVVHGIPTWKDCTPPMPLHSADIQTLGTTWGRPHDLWGQLYGVQNLASPLQPSKSWAIAITTTTSVKVSLSTYHSAHSNWLFSDAARDEQQKSVSLHQVRKAPIIPVIENYWWKWSETYHSWHSNYDPDGSLGKECSQRRGHSAHSKHDGPSDPRASIYNSQSDNIDVNLIAATPLVSYEIDEPIRFEALLVVSSFIVAQFQFSFDLLWTTMIWWSYLLFWTNGEFVTYPSWTEGRPSLRRLLSWRSPSFDQCPSILAHPSLDGKADTLIMQESDTFLSLEFDIVVSESPAELPCHRGISLTPTSTLVSPLLSSDSCTNRIWMNCPNRTSMIRNTCVTINCVIPKSFALVTEEYNTDRKEGDPN